METTNGNLEQRIGECGENDYKTNGRKEQQKYWRIC